MLIKALVGLDRVVSNVNIPNTGLQITNLPADAVVETNAVFARDSIKPLLAGTLPEKLREMMMPHIKNHAAILEASKSCDKELVVQSFLRDPLVKAKCTDEGQIRRLVDDMIRNTIKYLPEGWK